MAETRDPCLLLASARPLFLDQIAALGTRAARRWTVVQIPVDSGDLDGHSAGIAAAAAALVDTCPEPQRGIDVCEQLHRLRPDLSIAAWICCSAAFGEGEYRALRAAGVRSVLGSHVTAGRCMEDLDALMAGEDVLDVHAPRPDDMPLIDLLFGSGSGGGAALSWVPSAADTALLRLVAAGLGYDQIGERLHLTHDAVKGRLRRLRKATGTVDKGTLIAWAIRHGFGRSGPLPAGASDRRASAPVG